MPGTRVGGKYRAGTRAQGGRRSVVERGRRAKGASLRCRAVCGRQGARRGLEGQRGGEQYANECKCASAAGRDRQAWLGWAGQRAAAATCSSSRGDMKESSCAKCTEQARRAWPVAWVTVPRSSRTEPVSPIFQLYPADTSCKKPPFSLPINFCCLRSSFSLHTGLFQPVPRVCPLCCL